MPKYQHINTYGIINIHVGNVPNVGEFWQQISQHLAENWQHFARICQILSEHIDILRKACIRSGAKVRNSALVLET